MNSKKSHKLFSLTMLILIVGSIVLGTVISLWNVYEVKHERKMREDAIAAMTEAASESTSESTSEAE